MTDHDLTQIGIEAFGARRRMQQAIAGTLFHLPNITPKKKSSYRLFSFVYLDHAMASINRY